MSTQNDNNDSFTNIASTQNERRQSDPIYEEIDDNYDSLDFFHTPTYVQPNNINNNNIDNYAVVKTRERNCYSCLSFTAGCCLISAILSISIIVIVLAYKSNRNFRISFSCLIVFF